MIDSIISFAVLEKCRTRRGRNLDCQALFHQFAATNVPAASDVKIGDGVHGRWYESTQLKGHGGNIVRSSSKRLDDSLGHIWSIELPRHPMVWFGAVIG